MSIKMQRIDPYRVRIPRQGEMKTDGMIFASEELLEKGEGAAVQVANVACLPGIVGDSMAMPDVHWGYGFPIGGVAAFDPAKGGVISPGGVGYDINCGVRLHATDLLADDVLGHLPEVIKNIYNAIPSGVGSRRNDLGCSKKDLNGALMKGAGWTVEKGMADAADLECIESRGSLPADMSECSSRALERAKGQLGTLGSGNHFIEIGKVAQIGDRHAAEAFGLFEGQLTVMLHSGSRGFGHQTCDDNIRVMIRAARKYGIDLPDRQLCCAPVESPEGERYLASMGAAANFAFANRQIMGHEIGEVMERSLGIGPKDLGYKLVYDVCHNIAKIEPHIVDGKSVDLCVHRKGAVRALHAGDKRLPPEYREVGQPVLVPGDLGTCSYVLVGCAQAAELTFSSCCHGAGRVLSRKKAMRGSRGRSLFEELSVKGITVQAASRRTLAEEMPEAYKDVTAVFNVVESLGIAQEVAKLVPLAVIKG